MNDLTRSAAIHLYQKGRIDEARQVLLECIRKDPQDVPSWMWLVATIEDPDERIATLRLCLKANPDNAEVRQALVLLAAQKNAPEANTDTPLSNQTQSNEMLDGQSTEPDNTLPYGWIREMQKEAVQETGESEVAGTEPVSIPETRQEGVKSQPVEPGPEILPGETHQSEIPSAPAGSHPVEQLPKPGKKKPIFGFIFKVIAILVMLVILFSLVFVVWWVGSGHTTRELVISLAPAAVELDTPVVEIASTPVPTVQPTFPATYTPVPTSAPTATPAPTSDPALVMMIPDGMQSGGQENLPAAVSSGSLLAFQTASQQLRVIRLDSGEALFEAGISARMLAVTFSSDGKRLAVVDEAGIVTIWGTEKWQEEGEAQLLSDTGTVTSVQLAFTPDGYGLLAGYCPELDGVCTGTSAVVMLNVPGGKQRYSLAGVNRFASGSGDLMAVWQAGKAQNLLKLVSQFSGGTIRYLQLPAAAQQEGFSTAGISPGTSVAAGVTEQGSIAVWDGLTGKLLAAWQGGVRNADQVIFGPDGSQILVSNSRSAAQVWEYKTQMLVSDFNLYADYGTFFLDSDGAFRCVRAVTPVIELWDVTGLQPLESFSWGERKVIRAVPLLLNHQILTFSSAGEISLWNSGQIR